MTGARWASMPVAALVAALLTSQGAAAQTKGGSDRVESVPMERLSVGDHAFSTFSGLSDSTRLVVRDSSAWRQLWIALNRPFVPAPPLPPIDFAREMIIVAALGARPTGGYDIVIESAVRDSGGVEVDVRRSTPAAGCPVSAVVTQPVDLVRVPVAPELPNFRERTVITPCS